MLGNHAHGVGLNVRSAGSRPLINLLQTSSETNSRRPVTCDGPTLHVPRLIPAYEVRPVHAWTACPVRSATSWARFPPSAEEPVLHELNSISASAVNLAPVSRAVS